MKPTLRRLNAAKNDRGFFALMGEWFVEGDGVGAPTEAEQDAVNFCAEMEERFARGGGAC
jgi:hypothetical protein